MNRGKIEQVDAGDEEPVVDLITFMQASPLAKAIAEDGIDFEIDRSGDFDRDIGLFDDDEPS
jgi:hypothetical protein